MRLSKIAHSELGHLLSQSGVLDRSNSDADESRVETCAQVLLLCGSEITQTGTKRFELRGFETLTI
jgi:hypothetical protein